MPKFQETVLKNGLRILTEFNPNSRAVSMCIGVHVGSKDETSKQEGITHFIEHLVFKGTKSRTAYQLSESIEKLGGELNAYTGRDFTCFHTALLKEDYKKGVDILSDIVCSPKFSKKEFEKEKEVILHEIAMTEDYYEEQIFDDFFEYLYKGQSIGRPILGTKKSLKSLGIKEVKDFYKQNYIPDNMVFVCSGGVDHKKIVSHVKKYFRFGQAKPKALEDYSVEAKPFFKVKKKNAEQVHMLFGIPISSLKEGIFYEGSILNSYIAGGMTSVLYQELREKKPLCYSVYSLFMAFEDAGNLMIYIGTDKKYIHQVMKVIRKEIQKIAKEGLSAKVLSDCKKQWVRSHALQSDDLETRMNVVLMDAFLKRKYRSTEKVMSDVKKVSSKNIHAYIKRFFEPKNISVLVYGNLNKSFQEKMQREWDRWRK